MTKYANYFRRPVGRLAAIAAVGVTGWLLAGTLGDAPRAELAPLEEIIAEKSIGSPDAKVVIHEYASLTCPHCANFHTQTLSKIKKDFIDTGKVRLVHHDFPLGDLALAAAMLANCSGTDRYFRFLDVLYSSQQSWARAENPLQALIGVSRMVGLSEEDVSKCLEMEDLMWALREQKDANAERLGIQSTPTFFIEGQKVSGNLPYDDFKDVIEKTLARKNVN